MPLMRRLQFAAVVVLGIIYACLSHYSNSNPSAVDLRTALALGPMSILAVTLTWRWYQAVAGLLAAALLGWLLLHSWALLREHFPLIYLIQQCGFYGIMAFTFGRSLIKGRVPLCTQLADQVRGPLNELELKYTRAVTVAWVVFFLLNLLLTGLLYQFAPLKVWSLFVNFYSLPLILFMFAAEFAVRRQVLPRTPRDGLLATLRVYFANPR